MVTLAHRDILGIGNRDEWGRASDESLLAPYPAPRCLRMLLAGSRVMGADMGATVVP
jgi:hypothetical protein